MIIKKRNKKAVKIILIFLVLFLVLYILIPFFTTPHENSYRTEALQYDKMIALTFDDGPSKHTQRLLDGLKKYDAKASFFLLGKKVDGNRELIKEMQNDGHLIGSHTYSHPSMFNTSFKAFKEDLEKANSEIESVTNEKVEFFRPPHGHYTGRKLNKIEQIAVLWSNDPADWKNTDSDYVYEYLVNKAEDGRIFLLHDTKESTVDGVLKAVEELSQRGYKFVRADELLCRNGDYINYGLAYRSCKNEKSPKYF